MGKQTNEGKVFALDSNGSHETVASAFVQRIFCSRSTAELWQQSAEIGHCHPKIIKALQEQVEKLSLSSRAFYNDQFPILTEHLTNMLGYEMVLPMNTGAEGVETALKIAKKWS
ncbi:hypothetical protein Bca4012_043142 [Brassica carinata]|uniref:Ornithine aminotransferase n=1 Tax=Brassica carinata TaxID=52824 RepID=A0A8X7UFC2_BRACI|nr:hypothetical protein Bca52824_059187 [Brassica carinata]